MNRGIYNFLCQIIFILIWWHYPWLFCYLYCDVCIIDQNKNIYYKKKYSEFMGAVVVVIVWYLDLQLPITITTNFVSSIQHYVIKFVSALQQVSGFLQFPPPIKLTHSHDITEILLKVALNTITLTLTPLNSCTCIWFFRIFFHSSCHVHTYILLEIFLWF